MRYGHYPVLTMPKPTITNARGCGRIVVTEYSGATTQYNAFRPLSGCTPGEGSLASRSTDEMPLLKGSPRWIAYLALLSAERKLEMAGLEADARAVRQIRRAL